jgi:hypothetical protein
MYCATLLSYLLDLLELVDAENTASVAAVRANLLTVALRDTHVTDGQALGLQRLLTESGNTHGNSEIGQAKGGTMVEETWSSSDVPMVSSDWLLSCSNEVLLVDSCVLSNFGRLKPVSKVSKFGIAHDLSK